MHRIDSSGATVDNKFTEGNPGLSQEATVVDAPWLNTVQEEIAAAVEGMGLTLLTSGTDTNAQLFLAMQKLVAYGGRLAPVNFAPANNTINADVTGFPVFLTTAVVGIEFLFRSRRQTVSGTYFEMGRAYLIWDSVNSAWLVSKISTGDDSINFSVVTTGNANEFKLRYTTDDLTGASYAASLKITDIKYISA